jgi:serine/threonine protein kinase
MLCFVRDALGPAPPTKLIQGRIVRPLNDGRSGAHVFELEHGRVLKLYPERGAGGASYLRSIRDIVMTCVTPDAISPHVHDFGITPEMRPFQVMEKIDGVELFDYQPVGGAADLDVLLAVVRALREFNTSFAVFCRTHGMPACRPCHRDLHPHNIFITARGARFIDFDLAVCPYAALRDSDSPARQRALRHPWLQWLLGNYSLSTETYVHWTNFFSGVPAAVREDSDLLQVYLVCRYFERRTPPLRAVVDRLARTADKDAFLRAADAEISTLLASV